MRSLGWVEIAEDDLTPERSSKAVNRCIVDLSLGRNDLLDVVGRWGDVSWLILFLLLLSFCFIPTSSISFCYRYFVNQLRQNLNGINFISGGLQGRRGSPKKVFYNYIVSNEVLRSSDGASIR